MSTTGPAPRHEAQSAAAPSPFPPIADYAFLSNCHTGALIAPDGAIDWLCVPRFDAPSVFGSLLDREAGSFRLAPFGINHPSARAYELGTNILETTWKTPNGWILIRDALTMGPQDRDDAVTPHTRPPADDDADHMLVRTVQCLEGHVEVELVCEPAFDYGRERAEWTLVGGSRHTADATGAGQTSERRLWRCARFDPPPHSQERTIASPPVADRPVTGRRRDPSLARPGPGHLGGAREASALCVLEDHVLGSP